MFDNISGRYDFLDHFLSFSLDYRWRKKLVRELDKYHPEKVLDVATGTADLAIAIARACDYTNVIGIDLSEQMLSVGGKKIRKFRLDKQINLQPGDAEKLPFSDNEFDAVTVSFGVRNFEHLENGLLELKRVLKPGGPLLILEFSIPENPVFKAIYNAYFKNLVPFFGSIFAKNRYAYRYLQGSVNEFPYGENFAEILRYLNFKNVQFQTLSWGICTLYRGIK